MKLLDKPLSREEVRSILDALDGNISRICVSDDMEEIVKSLGFAIDRLSMLAYSRVKGISSKEDNK